MNGRHAMPLVTEDRERLDDRQRFEQFVTEYIGRRAEPERPWYRDRFRIEWGAWDSTSEWWRLMAAASTCGVPIWQLMHAAWLIVQRVGCSREEAYDRLAFNLERFASGGSWLPTRADILFGVGGRIPSKDIP